MFPNLIKAKELILDILFPPLCLNCQKHLEDKNELICKQCLLSIKLNNTLFCPVCRARLAENKRICHYDSPYLLAAAGNYDDPVLQNLIHYFKYQSFENLAPILGEIITRYIENCKLKIENFIIIPIPLHPLRERERGFNQARLIAEFAARNLNLELADELKRVKNNRPQVKLRNIEARAKNMINCFKIKNYEKIKGKNILLVDDVFTSGATMNEAIAILKANGAKRIIALVSAKA
ncbi:MAG: ComF family protein [Patescibacteria group bacterium]